MRTRISLDGDRWEVAPMQPSDWRWYNVGPVDPARLQLLESAWIPARVPGHVQSDLIDAGRIPDPGFHLNSLACEWTSQRDWIYRLNFSVSASHGNRQAVLRLEGVDWSCHVFLNGQSLGEQAGMYCGVLFPLEGRPFSRSAHRRIDHRRTPTQGVPGYVPHRRDATGEGAVSTPGPWCLHQRC
jgi:beta-mannosidase